MLSDVSNDRIAFGPFLLVGTERSLSRDGIPVELSARYLDALLLLAAHPGELIRKDRFMTEVWRGVPVTDEALTQCIRTLRRALGDDAARPRFIQTVPKHGYRFIAVPERQSPAAEVGSPATPASCETPLPALSTSASGRTRELTPTPSAIGNTILNAKPETNPTQAEQPATLEDLKVDSDFKLSDPSGVVGSDSGSAGLDHAGSELAGVEHGSLSPPHGATSNTPLKRPMPAFLILNAAGLVGGAAAGLVGGVGYGLLAANDPPAGTGAISVVLVLTCLCLIVGLLGGAGVGAGIAAATRLPGGRLLPLMVGGAIGGLVVGSLGRLVGLDAFTLLVGSRPVAITGGSEGLLVGALTGAAAWFALHGSRSLGTVAAVGASLGATAGLLVTLAGGQMMAGSLAVLASAHPASPLGTLIGGPGLPYWARMASGAIEGATFTGALALALALAIRAPGSPPRH